MTPLKTTEWEANTRDILNIPSFLFLSELKVAISLSKKDMVVNAIFSYYFYLENGVIYQVWALKRVSIFHPEIGSGFKNLCGTHLI